jgi:hypothetical protein
MAQDLRAEMMNKNIMAIVQLQKIAGKTACPHLPNFI